MIGWFAFEIGAIYLRLWERQDDPPSWRGWRQIVGQPA